VIDLTPEQLNMAMDIGILIVLLANAFFLLKNNNKLKNLNKRLGFLTSIKVK